jgi:hypothetical protein
MKGYIDRLHRKLDAIVTNIVTKALEGLKMSFILDGGDDSGSWYEIPQEEVQRELKSLDEVDISISQKRLAGFVQEHPDVEIADPQTTGICLYFNDHVHEQVRRQQLALKTVAENTSQPGAAMITVYVASPYAGDVEYNTSMARQYCRYAISQGVIPLAPHLLLTQFLNDRKPEERALGCSMGLRLLSHCQELWVFGQTISSGMAAEIAEAERLGIPTRYVPQIDMDAYPLQSLEQESGQDMGMQLSP